MGLSPWTVQARWRRSGAGVASRGVDATGAPSVQDPVFAAFGRQVISQAPNQKTGLEPGCDAPLDPAQPLTGKGVVHTPRKKHTARKGTSDPSWPAQAVSPIVMHASPPSSKKGRLSGSMGWVRRQRSLHGNQEREEK